LFDAIQARLIACFLLGTSVNCIALGLDVIGNQRANATDTSRQIDAVVHVADSPHALDDMRPRLHQALMLLASGFDFLRSLLLT
jgi:hypothetical protein